MPIHDFREPFGTPADVGSFANQASITVFQRGSVIYAVDDRTGVLVSSGTVTTTIIQTAVDALTGGGIVWLNEMTCPTTISIPEDVSIITSNEGVINYRLKHLHRTAHFDGRQFAPLLAQTLYDNYESGRNLLFQPTNISHLHDFCYDPMTDHVWGITRSDANDNYILKINPSDGSYSTISTGAGGVNMGMACCYGLGHVWFALLNAPAGIIKLDPTDDSITTYTMAAGENQGTGICFDGECIWMSLNLSPAKIIKFDPSDNSHTTFDIATANYLYWILWDGTYIWAIGNTGAVGTSAALVRFDPSDDSHIVYDLGAGSEDPHHIAFDGNHIWVATATGESVYKFDIDDAATKQRIDFDYLGPVYLVEYDGKYIWASVYSPQRIIRIAPSDGSYEIINLSDDLNELHCICFDGSHLWLGSYADPTYVMKYTPFLGAQAKGVICFDGDQTSLAFNEIRFIDTLALSAAENVTQRPIGENLRAISLSANILTNTLNAPSSGVRLRVNGVDQGAFIIVTPGSTGIFSVRADVYYEAGDLISVRVWTGGDAGAMTIGKVVVVIQ